MKSKQLLMHTKVLMLRGYVDYEIAEAILPMTLPDNVDTSTDEGCEYMEEVEALRLAVVHDLMEEVRAIDADVESDE